MGRIGELIIHEKQKAVILMQTCMETTRGEPGHKQTHTDAKLQKNPKRLSEVFNWLQKWGQLVLEMTSKCSSQEMS